MSAPELAGRRLGRNGPPVSAIGLGCMGMSEFYGEGDRAESVRTIRRAVELGITLFDTADMYGQGENERLLGKALGEDRGRVLIATKFGLVRGADGAFTGIDGSPEHVGRACEASLERLDADAIDLYQLHRVDPATPIEETVGAMGELVDAGKVRYLGLSEVDADQLRRAVGTAPIAAVQSEYSLLERSVEREVLPECERLGLSFLAFAPLMRGLIARRFEHVDELGPGDSRRRGSYPRLQGEALEANVALAQAVWTIADRLSAPPSAVAIAWLLQRSPAVVPIPGAKRVRHLEQNAAAAELRLSPEELDRLDEVVGPGGAARGERLPQRPHNR